MKNKSKSSEGKGIKEKQKYFKIGDIVEFHKGGIGKVISVSHYDNGKPADCCVEWNDFVLRDNPANSSSKKIGKNISISLPVNNISPKFNPIIRLYNL